MSYVYLTWNSESEGGMGKVRAYVDRVPTEGERWEFWNPDGSAADVHPDLDGNVFFVDQVSWIGFQRPGTPFAADSSAFVFLVPKAQYLAEGFAAESVT